MGILTSEEKNLKDGEITADQTRVSLNSMILMLPDLPSFSHINDLWYSIDGNDEQKYLALSKRSKKQMACEAFEFWMIVGISRKRTKQKLENTEGYKNAMLWAMWKAVYVD